MHFAVVLFKQGFHNFCLTQLFFIFKRIVAVKRVIFLQCANCQPHSFYSLLPCFILSSYSHSHSHSTFTFTLSSALLSFSLLSPNNSGHSVHTWVSSSVGNTLSHFCCYYLSGFSAEVLSIKR